jgi:hypothetical protein
MTDGELSKPDELRDDEDLEDEETGVLGGGGPATTWRGGEHGEDDEHLEDTDHREL